MGRVSSFSSGRSSDFFFRMDSSYINILKKWIYLPFLRLICRPSAAKFVFLLKPFKTIILRFSSINLFWVFRGFHRSLGSSLASLGSKYGGSCSPKMKRGRIAFRTKVFWRRAWVKVELTMQRKAFFRNPTASRRTSCGRGSYAHLPTSQFRKQRYVVIWGRPCWRFDMSASVSSRARFLADKGSDDSNPNF